MQSLPIEVLIVEDDSVDRMMLRRTLAQTALKVSLVESESASDALTLLSGRDYDVALIDYKLPDGTALSILKAMREKNLNTTPAIVLTAHAQKDLALTALNEGAQDFLPKDGINSDNLERSIRYSMQRSKLFQELQASKERELRERELRIFQQSSTESDTTKIPEVRDSQFLFAKFVKLYQTLITQSLEETGYKVNHSVEQQVRQMALELCDLEAGAKDVVEIHAEALIKSSRNARSNRLQESIASEGRVLLVQLMGYICMEYRRRVLGAKDLSK